MRILHVYKDYYPVMGGIENHIKLLAEAQAAAGHQITVLVTNRGQRSNEQILNGVRVIKTGRLFSVASTPISLQLLTRLSKECADITHLHFPYPPGETAQLFWGKSAHTVITYHSDVVRQARLLKIYKPIMLRALDKAERIIVSSQAYLESSPILPRFRAKCTVIPFGIKQEPFRKHDNERVQAVRKQYGPGP
ncbi:MAG: glycosyltransferase, partial [Chloroflexi bacterium]|nr:glycosyltransferase [Chloroflexota bacterium]